MFDIKNNKIQKINNVGENDQLLRSISSIKVSIIKKKRKEENVALTDWLASSHLI